MKVGNWQMVGKPELIKPGLVVGGLDALGIKGAPVLEALALTP